MAIKTKTDRVWRVLLIIGFLTVVLLPFAAAILDSKGRGELESTFIPAFLAKSILLPALGATLGLFFAVPLAVAASSSRRYGRLWVGLAAAGLVIPPFILCYTWEILFAEIKFLGFLRGSAGCVLLFALSTWPVEALAILGAIRRESARLLDAARLEAGGRKAFFGVALPLMFPGIAMGWTLAFILGFADFSVPQRLGVFTLSEKIAVRLAQDYRIDSAVLMLPAYLIVVVAALLALKILAGRSPVAQSGVFSGRGAFRPSPLAWAPAIIGLALSVVLPLGVLARDLSIEGVREVLGSFWRHILSSAILAAVSATCIIFISFLAAFGRYSRKLPTSWALEGLLAIPFALSGFLVAVGVKRALGWAALDTTPLVLVAAYIARYLFIAYEGTRITLISIDRSLLDAAELSGAGRFRRLFFIILPLSLRPLVAIWSLVFTLILTELDVALLVAPPSWETASFALHNQMHYGYNELTSALAFIMVALGALPFLIFVLAGPRYGDARN